MNNINDTIRTARLARGWSQQKLAEEVGVKQQDIQRIESGKVVPRYDKVERILAALNIKIDLTEI